MLHDFLLLFKLLDFLVTFDKIFTVQVFVTTNCFVKILLLLELCLSLYVLLLKLGDKTVAQLNFFKALGVFGDSLGFLDSIAFVFLL